MIAISAKDRDAVMNTTIRNQQPTHLEKVLEQCLMAQVALNPNKAALTETVAERAIAIAKEMGLSIGQRMQLELAALLHRVGEASLPEALADKSFLEMSNSEMAAYRKYPMYTALHVNSASLPLMQILLHHREYMDDTGFLESGREDEVPVEARILCVATEFEEMMMYHGQTEEQRMTIERRFAANATGRYDGEVIKALMKTLTGASVTH